MIDDSRQQIITSAVATLTKEKDRILLNALIDILGEDVKVSEMIKRVGCEYQRQIENWHVDGEIVLQFFPIESEIEDMVVTFKQNYKRFK